jgi:fatty acid desaturase
MTASTLPSRDELASLTTLDPARSLRDISLFWVLILLVIQCGVLIDHPAGYALGFVLMAVLQNQLITWVHEASHCNLLRDKARNDLIADLLLAGPAGLSVDQYRWHHVPHHRYLGDPGREIELVAWIDLRGYGLLAEVLKHLAGFYALQIIARRRRFSGAGSAFAPPPKRSPVAWTGFISANALLFAFCLAQGAWYAYFLLWVAPLFTLALMLSNFRTIVEHQVPGSGTTSFQPTPDFTRIVEAGYLERVAVAPIGFYYHYEHHLYPTVPYYNLPRLRSILEAKGHFRATQVERRQGYLRTLLQLADYWPIGDRRGTSR